MWLHPSNSLHRIDGAVIHRFLEVGVGLVMQFIPFYRWPHGPNAVAEVKICRVSDGACLWKHMFVVTDPIPQPPIDLDLEAFSKWGGYKVYLEWVEP